MLIQGKNRSFDRSDFKTRDGLPTIIAGPCSAESEGQVLEPTRALSESGRVSFFRAGVWKPRTQPGSFEGVGEIALEWLARACRETGLNPIIEIANPYQVEVALAAGITHFWIGARTTVNPFYVQEISEALSGVNALVLVKNPINPDISLWVGAIERFYDSGLRRIAAVHRGFSVYERGIYRNPPHWEIPIELKRIYPELPLICDPSHISGNRDLLGPLSQSALNFGYDGLMIEVHPEPALALSDSQQQITPLELYTLLDRLELRKPAQDDLLVGLRTQIDSIDHQLLSLLSQRMGVVREIGVKKKKQNTTVLQIQRWEQVLQDRLFHGQKLGLSEDFIKECFETIHTESIKTQSEC